jgi:hypothetical protein
MLNKRNSRKTSGETNEGNQCEANVSIVEERV